MAHYIERCAVLYNNYTLDLYSCMYMYEVYYSKKSCSSQSLIQQIAVTALPNISYIYVYVIGPAKIGHICT